MRKLLLFSLALWIPVGCIRHYDDLVGTGDTSSPPGDTSSPHWDTSSPEDTSCSPGCTGNLVCIGGGCQDIGLTWVTIPGGTFQMGCSPGDSSCDSNEEPSHSVTLSSFEMLETEVTEWQWAAVMGAGPQPCDYNGGGATNSPIECVDWNEAKAFCEAVSGRLPTEAEWEYAARGGTTTIYSCGDSSSCLDDIAWYNSNSGTGSHKHDVKGKDPNGYGLYDMSGNVWEWVEDCRHDDYTEAPSTGYPAWTSDCIGSSRVFRGGSFDYFNVTYLRVSYRNYYVQSHYDDNLGFRCCRSD